MLFPNACLLAECWHDKRLLPASFYPYHVQHCPLTLLLLGTLHTMLSVPGCLHLNTQSDYIFHSLVCSHIIDIDIYD